MWLEMIGDDWNGSNRTEVGWSAKARRTGLTMLLDRMHWRMYSKKPDACTLETASLGPECGWGVYLHANMWLGGNAWWLSFSLERNWTLVSALTCTSSLRARWHKYHLTRTKRSRYSVVKWVLTMIVSDQNWWVNCSLPKAVSLCQALGSAGWTSSRLNEGIKWGGPQSWLTES